MAAKWIELVTGSLEEKKRYREYRARMEALPATYASTAKAFQRYFMYYEDVDLALRGHELGWRYRLAPASRVRHRGSATASTVGDVVVFHRERNRLWVLFRHRPWADVLRGVWLSVRRLRWVPRGTHAHALLAGLAAAPRLVTTRVRGSAAPVNRL